MAEKSSGSFLAPGFFLNRLPPEVHGGSRVQTLGSSAARWDLTTTLADVCPEGISDELELAVAASYLWNPAWLASAAPALRCAQSGLVIGSPFESPVSFAADVREALGEQWRTSLAQLADRFGSQHSKWLLLVYPRFLRLAVFSNNLIPRDWERKTGSVWVGTFPRKQPGDLHASPFEATLQQFLSSLRGATITSIHLGSPLDELIDDVSSYDFSAAKADLVASVPGVCSFGGGAGVGGLGSGSSSGSGPGPPMGHLRMRQLLSLRRPVPAWAAGVPIVCQLSSQSRIHAGFERDLATSLAAGCASREGEGTSVSSGERRGGSRTAAAASRFPATRPHSARLPLPAALPPLRIVWPSVDFVRRSVEGWAGGTSLPCERAHLDTLVRRCHAAYDGSPSGRARSIPHIKTFLRWHPAPPRPHAPTAHSGASASGTSGDGRRRSSGGGDASGGGVVFWCYTGSHNISQAAWGRTRGGGGGGGGGGGAVAGAPGDNDNDEDDEAPAVVQIASFELGVLLTPELWLRGAQLEVAQAAAGRLPPQAWAGTSGLSCPPPADPSLPSAAGVTEAAGAGEEVGAAGAACAGGFGATPPAAPIAALPPASFASAPLPSCLVMRPAFPPGAPASPPAVASGACAGAPAPGSGSEGEDEDEEGSGGAARHGAGGGSAAAGHWHAAEEREGEWEAAPASGSSDSEGSGDESAEAEGHETTGTLLLPIPFALPPFTGPFAAGEEAWCSDVDWPLLDGLERSRAAARAVRPTSACDPVAPEPAPDAPGPAR